MASSSPRRSELLTRLGLTFQVVPPNVIEPEPGRLSEEEAARFVQDLARTKAEEVAARCAPGSLVLGSDTIVWLDGDVLNKPRDPDEARRMLRRLSGNEHRVYTGVAIKGPQSTVTHAECTRVRFKPLTDQEIDDYVNSGEPMDKAGAYGAQSLGGLLIEGITGDYFNVVGLPIRCTHELLKQHGIDVLERAARC